MSGRLYPGDEPVWRQTGGIQPRDAPFWRQTRGIAVRSSPERKRRAGQLFAHGEQSLLDLLVARGLMSFSTSLVVPVGTAHIRGLAVAGGQPRLRLRALFQVVRRSAAAHPGLDPIRNLGIGQR